MIRPTDVQVADVWRETKRVGSITRTPRGSVFEYDENFFAQYSRQEGGLAVHLPYVQRRVETWGTNLHTYFAGLLPEGLRLRALVQRVKTSEDDLLSLLIAAGTDTIGDLSVVPRGESLAELETRAERWSPDTVLFKDLFEQSLTRTAEGTEPVIPGVQEKVSASTISFPVRMSGRHAYILKLNPDEKPQLVQNEYFFMRMAKACGLKVATTRLIHDREKNPGLLVERFDRVWEKEEKRFRRLHQEDACQFLDKYPGEKYRIPCSDIAEGILETCTAPIPEMARFLLLLAFSYLIGNGDLHAKNVSILADGPAGGFRLSPAYDVLTTLPYGDRLMALQFEGRNDNLKRAHFIDFGERYGVKEGAIVKLLDKLCDVAESWMERLEEAGFDERETRRLRETMRKRLGELREAPPVVSERPLVSPAEPQTPAMSTVAQGFEKFMRSLELQAAEKSEAKRQARNVFEAMKRRLEPKEFILSGAYVRNTAIRPLHDIDLFLVFTEERSGSGRDLPGDFLKRVKEALEAEFPGKPVQLRNRSVNLEFDGTGIGFDVVPALEDPRQPGAYWIPDWRLGGWIHSNPRKHIEASETANAKAQRRLKPLIKAIKRWNQLQGRPVPSFLLEVMACAGIDSFSPDSSLSVYSQGLAHLLRFMSESILEEWRDPAGLGPPLNAGLEAGYLAQGQQRLAEAAHQAAQALELERAGDTAGALALWRGLLGDDFPVQ
ncbi:HipA domain-containing protein [Pyxidicoccus trucidator]|uniref:HipA domain-containing protein n=1 Tax=Pyxidicoccus trucidator TaxID=2709662 RepID=UPI0013D942E4|nr:HipA domain-containing protein [Pyxidicoccus trucidator]